MTREIVTGLERYGRERLPVAGSPPSHSVPSAIDCTEVEQRGGEPSDSVCQKSQRDSESVKPALDQLCVPKVSFCNSTYSAWHERLHSTSERKFGLLLLRARSGSSRVPFYVPERRSLRTRSSKAALRPGTSRCNCRRHARDSHPQRATTSP